MLENIFEQINKIAGFLSEALGQSSLLTGFFVYIGFILLYAVFFWNFHRVISKKNFHIKIIEKYIDEENSFGEKLFSGIIKLIQYFFIFPLISIFWFLIFSLFILFLSKNNDIQNLVLISASMIISIRILAFTQEDLSRNLSKIIPFTLMAVFIMEPGFSDLSSFLSKLNLIADLIKSSFNLVIFIILAEVVLRVFNVSPNAVKYLKEKKQEKTVFKKQEKKIKK